MIARNEPIATALASLLGVSYWLGDLHVWSWVGCFSGAVMAAMMAGGTIPQMIFRWFVSLLAAVMLMPGALKWWGITDPGVGMSISTIVGFLIWWILALCNERGREAAGLLVDRAMKWLRGAPEQKE